MKIVFVASEAVPFAKTGGLADVTAALPRALERRGHCVCLFLPCHRSAWSAGPELVGTGLTLHVPVGTHHLEAHVHESRLPGSDVPVYLIDQPAFFDRDDLYQVQGKDYPDNCARFVFFDRAVLAAIRRMGLRPDVIHCNDWQTGLIPAYLKTTNRQIPGLAGVGTLMTIHNLAYLGLFWHWDMRLTGLDWGLFHYKALEFYGRFSFLKAGLVFADMLSTVSPTYAREIQTPALGCGLDGLLRERQADLRGIVNGIEIEAWSPACEPMLARRYDVATFRAGKAACKAWLQEASGLPVRSEVPLLAQIGRLVPQKGWDLLAEVAHRLLELDVQLIVLGTGQPKYHRLLERLAKRYEGKLRVYLGFNDSLAHQIEAGADLFLMPSLYEPCGLNQLYSLAHGTVPLVRSTGGLADTVVNTDLQALADRTANGFAFAEPTAGALWDSISAALATWQDHETWECLVRNGMAADWSWNHSAGEYERVYGEILRRVRPSPAHSVAGVASPAF